MGGGFGGVRAALAILAMMGRRAAPAGPIALAPLLDAPGATVTLTGTAT